MDEHEHALVLAMPRRELFRVQGFVPPNDLGILESLAEESWYASPSALAGSFDAKEVRVGVIVLKPGHALISESGVLLHATPVPPEAGQLGSSGLAALKNFALAAGRHLLGTSGGRIELIGMCNEDALPECRGIFILVYKLRAPEDAAAPDGMAWTAFERLADVPLDPVSALVVEAVK
jgi:hypothetical protein